MSIKSVKWGQWPEWALVIASVPVLLSYTLFGAMHGDEGAFHNIATKFSLGLNPIIDVFSGYAPAWFAPYAAVMALFDSTHLETARLVSTCFILLNSLLAAFIAGKLFGRAYFFMAFILSMFAVDLFPSQYQVRHTVISNFGFLAACALMIITDRVHRGRFFLVGVLLATAAAVRLPVILVTVPAGIWAAYLAGARVWPPTVRDLRIAFVAVLPMALGFIAAMLVCFYPAFEDFDKFIFNIFGYRESGYLAGSYEMRSPEAFLRSNIHPGPVAFLLYITGSVEKAIIYIPTTIFGFVALVRYDHTKFNVNVVMVSLFSVSIILAYSVIPFAIVGYFVQSLPLFIILFVGFLKFALGRFLDSSHRFRKPVIVLLLFAGLAYSSPVIAKGAYVAAARHWGGARSVYAATKVACWLERVVEPGEEVLSWHGASSAIAGALTIRGWGRAVHLVSMTWKVQSEDTLKRYGILGPKRLGAFLSKGYPSFVIDDPFAKEPAEFALPEYFDYLRDNYIRVGTVGALTVYVSKQRGAAGLLPPLPATIGETLSPKYHLLARARRMSPGAWLEEARALARDLEGSFARMVGASYERRCASLLPQPQRITLGSETKM